MNWTAFHGALGNQPDHHLAHIYLCLGSGMWMRTVLNDFGRMMTMAHPFLPAPDPNWRNGVNILFTD